MFEPALVNENSRLGDKQRLFCLCQAKLVQFIFQNGFAGTCEDYTRSDRRGHMDNSCHYIKCAADINLFYWDEDHWEYVETYEENPAMWDLIGEYWESLHPLCRWGGRFNDYNHFSITVWGRK